MDSFDQLLNKLPNCDKFLTNVSLPLGVAYTDNQTPMFVSPYLTTVESGHPEVPTQVIIVSAPGAVGKSTLARQIAFAKGALLWDLATAHEVGSGSLDGMIFQSLETDQVQDFREYMKEGLQFLVIDALDEGRIKVNEHAFQRLLEDIAQLAQSSKGICFLLLGRTRIAETAWLVLEEGGANTSMLSIQSFDQEQANQYIDNSVSPEKRTTSFYKCRELIFEKLAFSITESSESESAMEFLHYPPVLDVVATLLKNEANLFELENSLGHPLNEAQDSSIHLLQNVINRILTREQQKVLPAIRKSLSDRAEQLSWSNWNSLYSSEEQCKRLLGSVFDQDIPAVPDSLPDDLRALYETSNEIATGLPEHPFLQGAGKLTNRVFESYLYSRSLLGEFGDNVKQLVTQHLLKQDRLPTRLLAAFYLAGDDAPFGTQRTIVPEHLGIIYDSLLSSESNKSFIRLTVEGSDPLGNADEETQSAEVDIEFLTFDSQGDLQIPASDPRTFLLQIESDSKISFANHLRDARITVPCTVELGVDGRECTIGPNVQVAAGTIVMRSQSLIVNLQPKRRVKEEEGPVILEATACDSTSITSAPRVYGSGRFYVSWPGAEQYPWTKYESQRLEADFADDENLLVAYRRFKRIATTLRSHGKGTLARTRLKIEHQRVLQGALGQALLEKLKADRILTLGEGAKGIFGDQNELTTS